MDRPLAAVTALLAVLLLVASILAMRNLRPPEPAPWNQPLAGRPLLSTPPRAERGDVPARLPVSASSDWLPALSGGTRTVLAQFADDERLLPASPELMFAPAASDDALPGRGDAFCDVEDVPYLEPAFDASPSLLEAVPDAAVGEVKPLPAVAEAEVERAAVVAETETAKPVEPEPSAEKEPAEKEQAVELDKAPAGLASAGLSLPSSSLGTRLGGSRRSVSRGSQAGAWEPEESQAYLESVRVGESERPLSNLLLLPVYDASRRSKELERIASQADVHCRKGFGLAGRGAYFSARAEFVLALRLLTQGLDAEHRTKAHSHTLATGWTALAEAEDFIPNASSLEADLDVPGIVRRHRTPVLHDADCEDLTSLDAVQSYLSFAQEQLAFAAGSEVAGSMALYGLGKIHNALAQKETPDVRVARTKALVFCQAALLACPRNYMASNELGITLAGAGRFEDACAALEHSVAIHSQPTGWESLSEVYGRIGRSDAAQRALETAEALRGRGASPGAARPNAPSGPVRWVDPNVFAKAAGQTLPSQPPAPAASSADPPQRQAGGWPPWKMFDARK